jgi:hypothetical protein
VKTGIQKSCTSLRHSSHENPLGLPCATETSFTF